MMTSNTDGIFAAKSWQTRCVKLYKWTVCIMYEASGPILKVVQPSKER